MESEYSERYASLYRSHWWWRAREALILSHLRTLVPPGGWGRILDVGCGDGLILEALAEFGDSVEGLEADATIVSPATARRFPIHIGLLDADFNPQGRYDLITLLDVLEHIEDPIAALMRCRDLLAPGGVLLITVPAFRSLWTHHDDVNRHFTRYTRRTLAEVLQRSGLTCTVSGYFFHWLVLPKLAVRAYERLIRGRTSIPRVPASPVNRGLVSLCILEQRTVTRLRVIPGSSLLAVASLPGNLAPD